jgi:pSer/pThr/pTyr-binding forkhead associated (FHA) protein/S1-C subfamily serine protease
MNSSRYVSYGKSTENDVVIDETHVSRHHLVVFPVQDGWHVYDLSSTNGTFVNGQRVRSASVSVSDVVTLGYAHRLDLTAVSPEVAERSGSDAVAYLRIGKSPLNDMVVEDPHVSRHHAILRRSAGGVEIYDAGSTNGCFVNGRPIVHSPLGKEDTVQLGQAYSVTGGELIELLSPVSPTPQPVVERGAKTGKTTWVRRQLDLMRNEQIRELQDLKRKQAHGEKRTRRFVVTGGVVVGVVVAIVAVSARFGGDGNLALMRELEDKRQAVVMIRSLSATGPDELSTPRVRTEDIELFSHGDAQESLGSGFVYYHQGQTVVITNKHVIGNWVAATESGRPAKLIVHMQGGGGMFEATVLEVHPSHDVALLGFRSGEPDCPIIQLQTDWSTVEDGDRVGFLSFPFGLSGQAGRTLKADVADGMVSNRTKETVKHSIPTAPGASGGPIFDTEGRVIAINQAQSRDQSGTLYQGHNWGVPVRFAVELLNEL